jgi:hypothetical protein
VDSLDPVEVYGSLQKDGGTADMADWHPSNERYRWWRLTIRLGIGLGLAVVVAVLIWALVAA